MSDHEFEKSVQQKMDGLKLRPSDAVWQGVELNLRRHRRRRRALFWLPAAVILLLTGGYFLYSGSTGPVKDPVAQTQESVATPSSTQPPVQPATRENAPASRPEQHNTAGVQNDQRTYAPQEEAVTAETPATAYNNHIDNHTTSTDRQPAERIAQQQNEKGQGRASVENNDQQQTKTKVNSIRDKSNQSEKSVLAATEKVKAAREEVSDATEGVKTTAEKVKATGETKGATENFKAATETDKVATVTPQAAAEELKAAAAKGKAATAKLQAATEKTAPANPLTNNDAATASKGTTLPGPEALRATTVRGIAPLIVPTPAAIADSPRSAPPVPDGLLLPEGRGHIVFSTPKWQWGITGGAGINNISEGGVFDLLNGVRVEDVTLAAPPPSFAGIPPTPLPDASPIRTGPVFSLGAFVQRNLSRRLSLSAGLQYTYASVYTKVGKRVDSMTTVNYGATGSRLTNQYYRADNELHDYTNRYHFIELPVDLHVHLTPGWRTPITLSGGFTLSRLVYTNALHFDGLTRVYFENDDFFNRFQAGFQSGVSIGLFRNSKHPVTLGPTIRYFATRLLKKEETAAKGQHIWSAGLQVKMFMH